MVGVSEGYMVALFDVRLPAYTYMHGLTRCSLSHFVARNGRYTVVELTRVLALTLGDWRSVIFNSVTRAAGRVCAWPSLSGGDWSV